MAKTLRCEYVCGLGAAGTFRCSLPPHPFHVEHAAVTPNGLIVWGGTEDDRMVQQLCEDTRKLIAKTKELAKENTKLRAELEAKRG